MRLLTTTLLAFTALTMQSSLAYADPHDRDHGRYEKHDDRHDYRPPPPRPVFHDHDRVVIRNYIVTRYRPHCPPGLSRKHNGCIPPGHVRHYVIGEPLGVAYEPIPQDLYVQLEPAPVGYRYVRVDSDVLLISEASHEVIDAITLLSAVGN